MIFYLCFMEKQKRNNNLLMQYAGFAFQFMAGAGLATYAGYEADKWIKWGIPIFIWLLPLVVIIAMLIKVVKDTSKK